MTAVTSRMAAQAQYFQEEGAGSECQDRKKQATSIAVKTSKVQPDMLHVVLVVDASLSMGTEDIEVLQMQKGSKVMLPASIRRIDAVFSSCRAFLHAHQDANGLGADVFSLVIFNSKAQVVFARLPKKAADNQLKNLARKVAPKHETKFLTAFRAVSNWAVRRDSLNFRFPV